MNRATKNIQNHIFHIFHLKEHIILHIKIHITFLVYILSIFGVSFLYKLYKIKSAQLKNRK